MWMKDKVVTYKNSKSQTRKGHIVENIMKFERECSVEPKP